MTESASRIPTPTSPLMAVAAIAINALGGAAVGLFAWLLVGILGSKAAPELAPFLRGHLYAPWLAPWFVPFVGLFAAAFGGTGSALRAEASALGVTLAAVALTALLGHGGWMVLGVAMGGLIGAALVALLTETGIELRLRRKPVRRAALLIGGIWLIVLLIAGAVISKKASIVACRVESGEPHSTTKNCTCAGRELAVPEKDARRKRGVLTVCIGGEGDAVCRDAQGGEVPCHG